MKNLKVLHIVRTNVLKVYISRAVVRQTRIAHTDTDLKLEKFALPTGALLKRLDRIQAENKAWEELFHGYDKYKKITYEDFADDNDKTLREILSFLDQAHRSLHSPLVKISPDKLDDIISNVDEVERRLRGSPYEHCLQDFH